VDNSKTVDGEGLGIFSSSLTGLTAGATYYVRAYATNSAGTAYGNQRVIYFSMGSNVTDLDGNIYGTIILGNGRKWMTQNLAVTKYRNGEPIPTGLTNAQWTSTVFGSYSIYSDNPVNDSNYGKLYNWYTVADPRGLCPSGYHVPSSLEWTELADYLGGVGVAGQKLKSISTLWTTTSSATNESGFSGLPGGMRSSSGSYSSLGSMGSFWCSEEVSPTQSPYFYLRDYSNSFTNSQASKRTGYSVRCIGD
jgi:uncharacterized protein (TIGR02145 family)